MQVWNGVVVILGHIVITHIFPKTCKNLGIVIWANINKILILYAHSQLPTPNLMGSLYEKMKFLCMSFELGIQKSVG